MKRFLLFAFILIAAGVLSGTELLAQESRTVWVIEFLNEAGRVTGSSTYNSADEAQRVLAEIRKGNRNLGWSDVRARIAPRQIQADIVGGKEVWPVRLADDEAKLEEKVGYVQRLLAGTELSELERQQQTLKREKAELESLRAAIVRDTNGLLSEPKERKLALVAKLEKMIEEYTARQKAFEEENARLGQQIRKFEQKKSILLQTENKLDLAEAYTPGVVSLRRQPAEASNPRPVANNSGNSTRPVDPNPNTTVTDNTTETSRTKAEFLRSSWKATYENSREGAGRVASIVHRDGKIIVNFWRSSAAYSYSGFSAKVNVDGTTIRLRSDSTRQSDVRFEGTLSGNRIDGYTTIGIARVATVLYRN